MTTKQHKAIDTDDADEIVVVKALTEMIQEEHWDLTDLGQQLLRSEKDGVHRHRLVFSPYGKKDELACLNRECMDGIGRAVWRCECGYRICRGCFEIDSRHDVISVVDRR